MLSHTFIIYLWMAMDLCIFLSVDYIWLISPTLSIACSLSMRITCSMMCSVSMIHGREHGVLREHGAFCVSIWRAAWAYIVLREHGTLREHGVLREHGACCVSMAHAAWAYIVLREHGVLRAHGVLRQHGVLRDHISCCERLAMWFGCKCRSVPRFSIKPPEFSALW